MPLLGSRAGGGLGDPVDVKVYFHSSGWQQSYAPGGRAYIYMYMCVIEEGT